MQSQAQFAFQLKMRGFAEKGAGFSTISTIKDCAHSPPSFSDSFYEAANSGVKYKKRDSYPLVLIPDMLRARASEAAPASLPLPMRGCPPAPAEGSRQGAPWATRSWR